MLCTTPCRVQMMRRSRQVIRIEAPGYEPADLYLGFDVEPRALRGSVAANGASGVASGAATGYFTGSLFSILGLTSNTAFVGAGAALGGAASLGAVAVDGATGSLLTLSPNPIELTLAPAGTEALRDPRVPYFLEQARIEALVAEACTPVRRKQSQTAYTKCKRRESERHWAESDVPAELEAMIDAQSAPAE